MLKNEIKFIIDFNINKLKNYSGLLTLSDIKKSGVHPAILKFILAKIEHQLFLDNQKLKKNSVFEYNDERVANYLNLINENIKRKNKFKFDYLSELVKEAVIFNVHFLIAPNKTLTEFIYKKSNTKTIQEISIFLSHIYYYKYFRKIILAFLEKKQIDIITKSEFIGLLKKIDKISTETHLTDTINTAVNSIANFFENGSSSQNNDVPVKAVELFLKGKRLTKHAKAVQTEYLNNDIMRVPSSEIKNLLNFIVEEEIVLEEKEETETNFEEEILAEEKNEEENIEDILEIEKPEEQIPDEELLSDATKLTEEKPVNENNEMEEKIIASGIVEKNKKDVIFKETNLTENFTPEEKTELTEETNEAVTEKLPDEINEEKEHQDILLEKPNAIEAIPKLINTEQLFDALLKEEEMQIDNPELTSTDEFLQSLENNELDFQFDKNTFDENLSKEQLREENQLEEQFQSVYEPDTWPEENLTNKEKLDKAQHVVEEIEDYLEKQKAEKQPAKITGETTAEIEKEIKEEEPLSLNNTNLNDFEPAKENIGKDDITLTSENDEEMTEVFSDLTYLESEETEEQTDIEKHEETVTEKEIKEKTENIVDENNELLNNYEEDEEVLTQTETKVDVQKAVAYSSFKEMVIQEDMSAIIETIFDYDMEDFQQTVNNISGCNKVTDALKILDEYCKHNYVLSSSAEVEKFEKLIIKYFKQTQA